MVKRLMLLSIKVSKEMGRYRAHRYLCDNAEGHPLNVV